jgi:hypothetical protein
MKTVLKGEKDGVITIKPERLMLESCTMVRCFILHGVPNITPG